MYNEERKMEWLNCSGFKKSTRASVSTVLNRIEKYEERLEKDCCDFTKEEVLAFYKEYNTSSVVSISNMNSQYKTYTEWCCEKGYTKTNSYAELTIYDWEKCTTKESEIITREDLLNLFKGFTGKISNPCDQFLCLALFEGICGTKMSELVFLTMSDFKGNEVHLNSGRVLTVSDKLLQLAQESAETYEKISYSGDNRSRKLKDEPYIFKAAYNAVSDKEESRVYNLRKNLLICRETTGVSAINQLSLVESGRIHMIKQFMKEQGYDNWEDAFKANADVINQRYQPSLKKDKTTSYSRRYEKYLE